MVAIHRHKQGLPMYNGSYKTHLNAIAKRLDDLPGLHLSANYMGGISVRDRIACAYQLADQIVPEFKQVSQKRKYFNFDDIPQAELEAGNPG
jgi:hypothetical protein